MKKKIRFYFFALAALGSGISGSDRIFIEFAKRWSKENPIDIFVWMEGYKMCKRSDLLGENIFYHVSPMQPWIKLGFVINYLARIIESVRVALFYKLPKEEEIICYSASDFWMDVLPCLVLRLRSKDVVWVASWYQTAPSPINGFSEGSREHTYRFNAFLYWFMQLPMKPLVAHLADFIFINNESERKQFRQKNKLVVVLGAVDLDKADEYQRTHKAVTKKYEAVFQGRFHPQKGVVELVSIWERVVQVFPKAKLAMIGDGGLMGEVKSKIEEKGLEDNIDLFGVVLDGPKKYQIFSESKMVVHPAFYDSGGMAAAEAMAFGLPAVGFDLPAYKSYYPQGMVKVEIGNLDQFASTILDLIQNPDKRQKIGKLAQAQVVENFDWNKRADQIYSQITARI